MFKMGAFFGFLMPNGTRPVAITSFRISLSIEILETLAL